MRVLAIRQPWASLIIEGLKDVEIRTMPTKINEYIAIYASRTKPKQSDLEWLASYLELDDYMDYCANPPTGKIIGTALLFRCEHYEGIIDFSKEINFHLCNPEWYNSKMYGWELANPEPLDKMIDFKFNGSIVWSNIPDDVFEDEN